ncbi:MAG: SGNH/GDSL hydrolase family protein [Myxococcales bacterium]|nr:SGNH/GDSL hydrolase family protein [Myxococcales bacterium]
MALAGGACGDSTPGGGTDGEDGTDTGTTEPADTTLGQDGMLPGDTGSGGSTTATSADTGTTDPTTGEDTTTTTGEPPPPTVEECFEGQFVNEPPSSDYDQYGPVVGSHCVGTNHQDIADVERVVFLGDSITVGSRPTLPGQSYRAVLADTLRDAYGLSYGDPIAENLWKAPNPFSGEAAQIHAGDFSSCARWGARNDDLPVGVGNQLEDCFPPESRELQTLVVMTSGGNDLSAMAQDAIDGAPMEDLLATAQQMVDYNREAMEWLTAPDRFPNGVYVVFANVYEFTDGTADVMSCDVSGLAGFDQPVPNPQELTDVILWINEQYMSIAVDTQTDMLLLMETFCGHGFGNDDPESPCYRGPGTPRWFDLTCIHPNPEGHGVIADNFWSIIEE